MKDILGVADVVGMDRQKAKLIAEEIRDCVQLRLARYL